MDNIDIREILAGQLVPNTIDRYKYTWDRYMEFCGTQEKALDPVSFLEWRQTLVRENKLAPGTINLNIRIGKSISKHLWLHGYIDTEAYERFRSIKEVNPKFFRFMKPSPRESIVLTDEDVKLLIKATRPYMSKPITYRDRAYIYLLATTGMRMGESLEIKVDEIVPDEKRGGYKIVNIWSKNKTSTREIPLSEKTMEFIQDWLSIRPIESPYVFSAVDYDIENKILFTERKMTDYTVYRMMRKYGKRAFIPNVKPHDLRRYVATKVFDKHGARTAQKLLGHSSINTTLSYYVKDEIPNNVMDDLV